MNIRKYNIKPSYKDGASDPIPSVTHHAPCSILLVPTPIQHQRQVTAKSLEATVCS